MSQAYVPRAPALQRRAAVQADPLGRDGGDWTVAIDGERAVARPGAASAPALKVKAGVADFVRIAGRDLDPGKALLTGRLTSRATWRWRRGWARCSVSRARSEWSSRGYDGGGFAALPATVARLFGVGEGGVALEGLPARADRVLLVLLDAFGWRFFTRHGEHPLLARMRG